MAELSPLRYRSAGPDDAQAVFDLYVRTPAYFDILSIPMPSVDEVRTDLATAASDPRRITEVVHRADVNLPGVPDVPVGEDLAYLDVTLDYLEPGDATVNLLLVRGDLQRHGVGRRIVSDLERRLRGRCRRILASVYGRNPMARRFWTSQGFHFAIDAAPVLEWYAKRLGGHDPARIGDQLAVADRDAAG